MNPSTEISPSTTLFLDELHKLFDEYEARWDRRFAEFGNTWRVFPAAPDSQVRVPSSPAQIPSPPLAVKQEDAQATSGVVSVPIHAAAIETDVVADNWGGFIDGGIVSSDPHCVAPSITASNWDGLFEQPTRIMERVPDGLDTVPAPSSASATPTPAPSATSSADHLDLTADVIFSRLASTDQICRDNSSKVPGLAIGNRFTGVDDTDEQYFYWGYADPRCFVPLLGHRPSCGRPPPHSEQYRVDAADSTRLDPPSPPPLLLDTGDPVARIHIDVSAADADARRAASAEVPPPNPDPIGDEVLEPRWLNCAFTVLLPFFALVQPQAEEARCSETVIVFVPPDALRQSFSSSFRTACLDHVIQYTLESPLLAGSDDAAVRNVSMVMQSKCSMECLSVVSSVWASTQATLGAHEMFEELPREADVFCDNCPGFSMLMLLRPVLETRSRQHSWTCPVTAYKCSLPCLLSNICVPCVEGISMSKFGPSKFDEVVFWFLPMIVVDRKPWPPPTYYELTDSLFHGISGLYFGLFRNPMMKQPWPPPRHGFGWMSTVVWLIGCFDRVDLCAGSSDMHQPTWALLISTSLLNAQTSWCTGQSVLLRQRQGSFHILMLNQKRNGQMASMFHWWIQMASMFHWWIQLQPWPSHLYVELVDSGAVPWTTPWSYFVRRLSRHQWVVAPTLLYSSHKSVQCSALICRAKLQQPLCVHQICQPHSLSSHQVVCAATMLIEMEFLPLRMVISLEFETSQNRLSSWSIISSDSYDHTAIQMLNIRDEIIQLEAPWPPSVSACSSAVICFEFTSPLLLIYSIGFWAGILDMVPMCPWLRDCQRKQYYFISMMAQALSFLSWPHIDSEAEFDATLLNQLSTAVPIWPPPIALLVRRSVLLGALLDATSVILDICWELMMFHISFLTNSTSKEVQYSANCLSWTYALFHELFGPSMLINMAAKGIKASERLAIRFSYLPNDPKDRVHLRPLKGVGPVTNQINLLVLFILAGHDGWELLQTPSASKSARLNIAVGKTTFKLQFYNIVSDDP